MKMLVTELAAVNLQEVRRRSIIVWKSIPQDYLDWRPDREAMSMGEHVRHVWSSQAEYHEILKVGKSIEELKMPYFDLPVTGIENEIALSTPYHQEFLDYVRETPPTDLNERMIDRSDVGYVRTLGDMFARIAYHEAVHTGQILQQLRAAGLDRPLIWD